MMIRIPLAAAAAFLTLALAGQAAAQHQVTAKLEQPVAERSRLVAGGAVFWCEGEACIANAANTRTYVPATCKDVASKYGPVTAFESGARAYDAERLEACNAAARPQMQAANP
ncbi:MAG: hypothetical protein Q7V15_13155 [Phenylobacterium sp.]|uniref:CC_3452 family protein n=1 Tax=Phenylobacterium sp. TaxID=1871053 RepID=UPI0027267B70|nr:hypothetical protein [Phenylobacterium sp.]MDO8902288.1 hypothetical protein [Phenylobacterium sp.]MDP2213905.1 hypothetical protein [Phenylobacterium sp.]